MNKPPGAGKSGPRRRNPLPDLEALAAVSGKVTALEAQRTDPRRRSVYVDGQFILGLHEESVLLAGLKPGLQVDGALLVRAFQLEQAKRAKDDALVLLSASAKSRRDVEKKLLPRYGPEVTESVLEWLTRGGWLDDDEFARAYIRSHASYGARRLAADLARRGVARDVAQAAIGEALGAVSQTEQAREAAASRLARMPGADRETAQRRLSGFLARRGYDFETIARALAPLLADLPRAPRPAAAASRLNAGRTAGGGLTRRSGLGSRAGRGGKGRTPGLRAAAEEDES